MKYPRANNFLEYKRIDFDICKVKDIRTGETWELGMDIARFLKKLDGRTNPYAAVPYLDKDFIDSILSRFYYEGLIRTDGRIMPIGIGSVLCTLYIPRIKRIHRCFAKLLNTLLLLLCIPSLICGIYIYVNALYSLTDGNFSLLKGYLLGLGAGFVLHELAHACACLAYGGQVYEFGVALRCFLPGAYVCVDYDNVKSRFKRAQINAAGVEMNLFLSGIFMCISCCERLDSLAFLYAALMNIAMAALNVSLAEGIDGMGIISEFLGVDGLVEKARNVVRSGKKKRALRKKGINGCVTIIACYCIVVFQIALPLILVAGVMNCVAAFF